MPTRPGVFRVRMHTLSEMYTWGCYRSIEGGVYKVSSGYLCWVSVVGYFGSCILLLFFGYGVKAADIMPSQARGTGCGRHSLGTVDYRMQSALIIITTTTSRARSSAFSEIHWRLGSHYVCTVHSSKGHRPKDFLIILSSLSIICS